MLEQYLSKLRKNEEGLYKIYDRFSFDDFFRSLLSNDFDYEDALNFILCNCSLSAIVFQERIYNNYYLNISAEDTISNDLRDLRNETLLEIVTSKYSDIENRVGPVSKLIRQRVPKKLKDWERYYYEKVYPREHLEGLGRELYVRIAEVTQYKGAGVTEKDCIDFVVNLVIGRTYDGYQSEIQTIYGQLQQTLGVKIEPAPDEWDRGYNIDFFIKVRDKFIGLQIKPAGYAYITQIINELEFQRKTHEKFTAKYGGKVFYIFSMTEGKRKVIYNSEVIEEIRKEIERLEKQ